MAIKAIELTVPALRRMPTARSYSPRQLGQSGRPHKKKRAAEAARFAD